MEIYLVGGAVRDQLLGRPIKERDWVVVGSTPEEMLAQGFRQVGNDFPVFLHPQTHEEYALARTERKTAKGYKGFVCYAAPDVTLEQDLQRRDLTINAIAQTIDKKIIDPYGGQADLKARILRHVSTAFAEDPVRILRVARFAARFADFNVHPSTLTLMQQMVIAGEVNALVAERVWQEWERALSEANSQRFFEILAECKALTILFPELMTNEIGLTALKRNASLAIATIIKFAILLHALPKSAIENLCQRYRVPRDYQELAILVAQYYPQFTNVFNLTAEQLLRLLESLDAFRRQQRFQQFLTACTAVDTTKDKQQKADYLLNIYQNIKTINAKELLEKGLQGTEISAAIANKRLAIIKKLISS